MKSGVIGVVSGEFEELNSEINTFTKDGEELHEAIEILDTVNSNLGKAFYGRAAVEDVTRDEGPVINDEQIEVKSYIETETKMTEFLAVSGEFVIVENGSGTFAFNLIGRQAEVLVERGRIDLDAYVDYLQKQDRDEEAWQAGFYGNGGEAEKGVVYGNNVLKDSDVGGVLDLSDLNQLGVSYSTRDHSMKITVTESGYTNVYQPSNFESEDFLNFFASELAPYVSHPN